MTYKGAEDLRSTLTERMEVILDLPLLHIYVQEIATFTAYKLTYSQTPISKSHDANHQTLADDLKETLTT